MVPARNIAAIRAMTTSAPTPEHRAISSNGSCTNPSILSSEIARILALIGSLCSTGSIPINPTRGQTCPTHTRAAQPVCDRRYASERAGQHGCKMTACAGKDEQVPDKMRIARAFPHIKQDACRVSDSTGEKPEQSRERNRQRKRPDENESQPAHSQIKKQR